MLERDEQSRPLAAYEKLAESAQYIKISQDGMAVMFEFSEGRTCSYYGKELVDKLADMALRQHLWKVMDERPIFMKPDIDYLDLWERKKAKEQQERDTYRARRR